MKCIYCNAGQWKIREFKDGYTWQCNCCTRSGFYPINYNDFVDELRKEAQRQKYEKEKIK